MKGIREMRKTFGKLMSKRKLRSSDQNDPLKERSWKLRCLNLGTF